ncbi:hypothetical protein HY640_00090 [Candidatus Woesearchaeota archaeon]|nr:hypothetical protein [Candidatus Woesearchaeota archaeon]
MRIKAFNRKGWEVFASWLQIYLAAFLFGVALVFAIRNSFVSYSVFFLCGLATGIMIYTNRSSHFTGDVFTSVVFLAGGFAGNFLFGRGLNLYWVVAVFVAGNLAGFYVLNKRLIKLI